MLSVPYGLNAKSNKVISRDSARNVGTGSSSVTCNNSTMDQLRTQIIVILTIVFVSFLMGMGAGQSSFNTDYRIELDKDHIIIYGKHSFEETITDLDSLEEYIEMWNM